MGGTTRRGRSSGPRSLTERWATATLLIGAGLALLLVAVRLVAAAFSWSFSPFGYLSIPDGHGWRMLLLLGVAVACAALLPFVLRREDDALWLEGERGGVIVGVEQLETLLRDQAAEHPEVARAQVRVRARKGRPQATLDVALRPLVAGDTVAGELAAAARERLVRVSGLPDVQVQVRHRVLTVSQLAKVLP